MQHDNSHILKQVVALIAAIFLIATSPAVMADGESGGVEINQLLSEARVLEKKYKDGEALRKYLQVLKLDSQNVQALCQSSRLYSRMGGRYSHESGKLQHFREAHNYASRALAADSNSAEAYYVMALAIGNLATVNGLKDRLAVVPQVKFYLDKALAINPELAEAWHLLGRWHFKVANYNVAQIVAANMFFGGMPQDASTEKAVEALEMAIKIEPENLLYYYDLARVYLEINKHETCVETLQSALNVCMVTSEDLELNRRCKNMLQQITKM